MAQAFFEGRIAAIFPKSNRLSLIISERIHWDCEQTDVYRLVAWGKKGQALAKQIQVGQYFRFSCKIEINQVDANRTYTNFTVQSWREVIKPSRLSKRKPQEPSCDWHVQNTRDRDAKKVRRYEGWSS